MLLLSPDHCVALSQLQQGHLGGKPPGGLKPRLNATRVQMVEPGLEPRSHPQPHSSPMVLGRLTGFPEVLGAPLIFSVAPATCSGLLAEQGSSGRLRRKSRPQPSSPPGASSGEAGTNLGNRISKLLLGNE